MIEGRAEFNGKTYRVWLKNENLVGWLDDVVHATIPDLICMIDTDTGEPITNPYYKQGQNVAIVVLPAPQPFLTSKGLEAFGPRYAGIDAEYRPAAKIVL